MRRHWLSLIFAMLIAIGSVSPVFAQDQKGHRTTAGTPPAGVGDPGCDLIEDYVFGLYGRIDDSGAFADFFYSDDEWDEVTVAFAEEVREDGEEMLADLRDLDVPGAYAEAHEGILTFLALEIDVAHFYGIDSSVVPDLNAQTEAFALIGAGEIAIAEACPDEIDEVGGYILLEPGDAPIDPDTDPDAIPE